MSSFPVNPPPQHHAPQTTPAQAPAQIPSNLVGPATSATTPQQVYARPTKRPRELTDDEAAAIVHRNYARGDFIVGNSAPVRIDTRLPVKLVLGENDHVHFTIGSLSGYPGL
jgi:hypothetical protein